jgi:hypothetical protein
MFVSPYQDKAALVGQVRALLRYSIRTDVGQVLGFTANNAIVAI